MGKNRKSYHRKPIFKVEFLPFLALAACVLLLWGRAAWRTEGGNPAAGEIEDGRELTGRKAGDDGMGGHTGGFTEDDTETTGSDGPGGDGAQKGAGEEGDGGDGEAAGDDAQPVSASVLSKPKSYSEAEALLRLEELAGTSEEYRRIYEARKSYLGKLLSALCSNPELLPFALGYPDAERAATGELGEEEAAAVPLRLFQWDERWGYAEYGGDCLGLTGCAPTCLSMVYIMLTGDRRMTPDKVAVLAQEGGYYVKGVGTSWSLMTRGAAELGLCGTELSLSWGKIKRELESGHPVICSMRPGNFTTEGHFIVLAGVSDGKLIVCDPNSRSRSEALWDYETIKGQIKNLWAFSEQ